MRLFLTPLRIFLIAAQLIATLGAVLLAPTQPALAAIQGHLTDVKAVATGNSHNCALLNSGAVKCWGLNNLGQLGDGTTNTSLYPVDVIGINNAVEITAGEGFTCIINNAGKVKCWGDNRYGQLGAPTSLAFSSTPIAVETYGDLRHIDAGSRHVCGVVTFADEARCWGSNNLSQIAYRNMSNPYYPGHVNWGVSPHVIGIGGDFTCFSGLGETACWGANLSAQLGRGFSSASEEPTSTALVSGLPTVLSLALGYHHACATQFAIIIVVSCWGANSYGQTGNGAPSSMVLAPTTVVGLRTAPKSVSLGNDYTCALLIDETVQCWGDNNGKLGDGGRVDHSQPTNVLDLAGVAQIDTAYDHACAALTSGEVKCWGENSNGTVGLLGTGNTVDHEVLAPAYVVKAPATQQENDPNTTDQSGDAYEYGDAPPNGLDAYAGVPSHFPTLRLVDNASSLWPVYGPRHQYAGVFLGDAVSQDMPTDADGVPNIDQARRLADQDGNDDGWLNPDASFQNCQVTTLRIRLRAASPAVNPPLLKMRLNVWFDGNRDGDWQDSAACPDGGPASEWLVRNRSLDTLMAPGDATDIEITTTRVLRTTGPDNWLRISLSDKPAPAGRSGDPDGQGPSEGYDYGETEDYLVLTADHAAQYGTWPFTKTITYLSPSTPGVGGIVEYTLDVTRKGGSDTNVSASVGDEIPRLTTLDTLPTLTVLAGSVKDTSVSYTVNPNGSPHEGSVNWSSTAQDGAHFQIKYRVRVLDCPFQTRLENQAKLIFAGKTKTSEADLNLDCVFNPPPVVTFTQQLVTGMGLTETLPTADVGNEAFFMFSLAVANLNTTYDWVIADTLPLGLSVVDAVGSAGTSTIDTGGTRATLIAPVTPGGSPTRFWVRARVSDPIACGTALYNSGLYDVLDKRVLEHIGYSNVIEIRPNCADLGDAPDSTNHDGKPITAYGGISVVQGNFPTRFYGPLPTGPRHDNALAMSLGNGASVEAEADGSYDEDGVNNLDTSTSTATADHDQLDDGLSVMPPFSNCVSTPMTVAITLKEPLPPEAYLNAWFDGNRDGDWADEGLCGSSPAREHFVVDQKIDVTALGPGTHSIVVPTGLINVPLDTVWMRLTLSDKPANKTLPVGCSGATCTYGDGRGYDLTPFAFGETEDILWRAPSGSRACGGVDCAQAASALTASGVDAPESAFLRMAVHTEAAPDLADHGFFIVADVRNIGNDPAQTVNWGATLGAAQATAVECAPACGQTNIQGNAVTGVLRRIPVLANERVLIRATYPVTIPPGGLLTGILTTTLSGALQWSFVVPRTPTALLSPRDTLVRQSGAVTLSGVGIQGVNVSMYATCGANSRQSLGTATVGAGGLWSKTVALPITTTQGSCLLEVADFTDPVTNQPRDRSRVQVDKSLPYEPASLRLTDSAGRNIVSEVNTESGWRVYVRPGEAYTIGLQLQPGFTATVMSAGRVMALTDPDGDGVHGAALGALQPGTLLVCAWHGGSVRCMAGAALPWGDIPSAAARSQPDAAVNPLAMVYDAVTGQTAPLAGATVTAHTSIVNGPFLPTGAGGESNPQSTSGDGFFSYYPPSGQYWLRATAPGYQPYTTGDIAVSGQPLAGAIPLAPVIGEGVGVTVTVGEYGFTPGALLVPTNTVVAFVNVDGSPHSVTSASGASALDSGVLQGGDVFKWRFTAGGRVTLYDRANPLRIAAVQVGAPSAPPGGSSHLVYMPVTMRR